MFAQLFSWKNPTPRNATPFKLVKSVSTDPVLRILSISQIDKDHVFVDAGKQAHILNIETLDEVCTIKTNQPTRYT